MANAQHIEWLREGVESWNKRRNEQDFGPDFSGANLDDANLDGANLSGANLNGANLNGVVMKGARLNGARLSDASLIYSDLSFTSLDHADLTNVDLNQSELVGSTFQNAKLEGANLTCTNIWQANLWFEDPPLSYDWQSSTTYQLPCVDSISSFLETFGRLRIEEQYTAEEIAYAYEDIEEEVTFYFRGKSSDNWELKPSVMRRDGFVGDLRYAEGKMLLDLYSRRPEDFADTASALDEVVIARQHGLPTRLLDIIPFQIAEAG